METSRQAKGEKVGESSPLLLEAERQSSAGSSVQDTTIVCGVSALFLVDVSQPREAASFPFPPQPSCLLVPV